MKPRRRHHLWLLVAGAALLTTASQADVEGRVVAVTDGDTIKLLDAANRQHRIRLTGIDAPEKAQPFGEASRRHLARPGLIDEAPPEPPARVRVLSPFDPMIRDRKRARRLFGFDYTIEVFVPAAKRVYGYYVFPLMEGDAMIGRIDMTCRRQAGTLSVTGLWLEQGVRTSKGRLRAIAAELERHRRFTGMDAVRFEDGWLRETQLPE